MDLAASSKLLPVPISLYILMHIVPFMYMTKIHNRNMKCSFKAEGEITKH